MEKKKTHEPSKKTGGMNIDTSNLSATRMASAGSAYDKAVSPDTEGLNTPSYGSLKPQKGEEKEMSKAEAVAYVQRVAGVDEKTAEEMNEAVWQWTNGAYSGIRHVQQGVGTYDEPYFKKLGDNLERFIERSAKWGGGTTYRGIGTNADIKVGETFDMRGTASWSTQESVARNFAYGDGTVFVSKTQSRGVSTNFSHQHHSEREVTVSRKALYVAERIEYKNGKKYIYVREA